MRHRLLVGRYGPVPVDPKDPSGPQREIQALPFRAEKDGGPFFPEFDPGIGSDGKEINLAEKYNDHQKFEILQGPKLAPNAQVWDPDGTESLEEFYERAKKDRDERQAKAKAAQPQEKSDPPKRKALDQMNVDDLRQLAEEKGVDTKGSTKHAELVRMLKAAGVQ